MEDAWQVIGSIILIAYAEVRGFAAMRATVQAIATKLGVTSADVAAARAKLKDATP